MSLFDIPITLAEYAIMNAKINEVAKKRPSIPPPPGRTIIIGREGAVAQSQQQNTSTAKPKKKIRHSPPPPPIDIKAPEINVEKVLDEVISELKKESKEQKNEPEQVPLCEQVGQIDPTSSLATGTTTTVVVKKTKMKKWPDNPSELLSYYDIINPLKAILTKGYRLFRKEEIKSFDYDGYNIGKHELQTHPSPRVRLSEKYIKIEKKSGNNLIDIVLNIVFLMGIEQGRRAERHDFKPVESLLETLETYRKNNKDQRIRIDELEVMLELKEKTPHLSEDDFKKRVYAGMSARRAKRIEALRAELQLDASRSTFKVKTTERVKFRELERLAKTLTKETCTHEQWLQILEERGWTLKEWLEKCKKKLVKTDFS